MALTPGSLHRANACLSYRNDWPVLSTGPLRGVPGLCRLGARPSALQRLRRAIWVAAPPGPSLGRGFPLSSPGRSPGPLHARRRLTGSVVRHVRRQEFFRVVARASGLFLFFFFTRGAVQAI